MIHPRGTIGRRCAVLAIAITCLAGAAARAEQYDQSLYAGMRWRMIGPHRGGRALAVAGVPGRPNLFYFGSVAGGIWKTTNAGQTWEPIFDAQPIASIGAIAVAASDPDVIYAGTGEADMRSDISFGDGVYKSTDAGQTWKNIGLRDSRHIGRILVDPRNPGIVLVAALGHAYGGNAERGVFRSSDGGATWRKVLYKDENTGAIDLAFDPGDPRTVYAALWRTRRTAWSSYPPEGGPGGGIYKSTDGGVTWTELAGRGLPAGEIGRIGIAVAPGAHGSRVYALIDAKEGGLYRSDDSGATWRRVNDDKRIRERGWYFGGVTVDPHDPDTVYVADVALYRSNDAGGTFTPIKGAPGGDDYHALWIDPGDSGRMILGSDQGVVISVDGGRTWSSWFNQPTAQFYHVATDDQFPYRVYGAQQDSGTAAVSSRGNDGSITFRDWFSVGAGESGYIAPDPADPDIVYGGDTYGALWRFDRKSGQSQNISPEPWVDFSTTMEQRKLRFPWTSPLAFSPQNPHVLYYGSQYLLRSTDEGRHWEKISPDLTGSNPKAAQATASEPLDTSNAKVRGFGAIYSIAPSTFEAGPVWVGTDTGLIHLTRDGGRTWVNVTPPGLSDWARISIIDASRHDAATAYAAVDAHRLDDYRPHVYRTHDYGRSWTEITRGIAGNAYVHAVREDPRREGLLFAGTELGVYVSFDDGGNWQPLQLNMPAVPVHDLVVHEDDLVAATHGRSFWILDDVTPLRQLTPVIAAKAVAFFAPAAAYRMRRSVNTDTPLAPEFPAGTNPPAGAIFDYFLKSRAEGEVALDIRDSHGRVVRLYSSGDRPFSPPEPPPIAPYWFRPAKPLSKDPGMHRFVWDLRYSRPPLLKPDYSMAVAYGQDAPPTPEGPLVLPGTYEARLTVAGQTFRQSVEVKMDPRVATKPEDLAAMLELDLKISTAIEEDAAAWRRVRDVRAQLKHLRARPAVATSVADLDREASLIEGRPPEIGEPGGGLMQINLALAGLAIVVESADRAPTAQARAFYVQMRRELDETLARWKELEADFASIAAP
jgi:photosystem II stability/assembly factor-like uncharacterized protein